MTLINRPFSISSTSAVLGQKVSHGHVCVPLPKLTDNPITMLPRRLKPFFEQLLKLPKRSGLDPSKHFNILQREFERGSLESDISRRVGQHETKIDMDEVSVAVEEDVAVVSVFDLEEVGDEGVACEGFGKVALGPGEFG